MGNKVSHLDVLWCFAALAIKYNYSRPCTLETFDKQKHLLNSPINDHDRKKIFESLAKAGSV